MLEGPVLEVAPLLLGAVLRHDHPDGPVAVRLTEVEAYAGPPTAVHDGDPASHSFRGRSPRNAVMFGPPGRLYVYLSYGMHWCANVVTGPDGSASAVLLRAGEVVEGADLARRRRGTDRDTHLARGPGCLGQALALDASAYGADLAEGAITLDPPQRPEGRVRSGPRVGVSAAADRPWRFWLDGDPTVSAYRRSPRAPRP